MEILLSASAAVSSSAVVTSFTPFATGSAAYSPFSIAAASFPDALSGDPGPSVNVGGFVSCPVSAADTGEGTKESIRQMQIIFAQVRFLCVFIDFSPPIALVYFLLPYVALAVPFYRI